MINLFILLLRKLLLCVTKLDFTSEMRYCCSYENSVEKLYELLFGCVKCYKSIA